MTLKKGSLLIDEWRRLRPSWPMCWCNKTRSIIWAGFLLWYLATSVLTATAAESSAAGQMLARAELIKRSDFNEYGKLLNTLESRRSGLSPAERDHLSYLRAWQRTYAGEFDQAISEFKELIGRPVDPTLRFRATATLVNALTVARRYDESFRYLGELLDELPQVSDKDVRSQALGVAALLHNQVGQYDLSLGYSDRMLSESTTAWVRCGAAQFRLESLFKSGKLTEVTGEQESLVQRCVTSREFGFANFMRAYIARHYLANGRIDMARALLVDHRDEVERTRYPRLMAEFDSLLAETFLRSGDFSNARKFGTNAIANVAQNEFTEPLVDAYRVLYEVAERQGDNKQALEYHKKYMAADKAYLDDISARQLAFQMAQHQSIANKLQIETLNQQNQVLQMQGQLADKAAENTRLYLALLLTVLASIALWAYKTKRSQLHFMRQAQHDGLTGICTRVYFMQQAEAALEQARRNNGRVSVLIIDLDHFKIINDAHGHAAGDTVLKTSVTACRRLLGKNDIFGRLGGEEFGVLLPDRDAVLAAQVAEQLRLAVAQTDTGDGRDEFPISASFGVSSTTLSGYKLQQLLAHADSALYQAKRHGRNRVEIYKPAPGSTGPAARELSPITK